MLLMVAMLYFCINVAGQEDISHNWADLLVGHPAEVVFLQPPHTMSNT